jgi:glycosyltransferase involved in cell wall biosynthesis
VRVVLDTTFSRRGASGTAVYVARLAEALEAEGVEVCQVANERRGSPGAGSATSVRNLLEDWRWTAVELPRQARRLGADVLHHPLPAHSRGPCPQVTTVHDLAFVSHPELFDRRFAVWAAQAHARAVRRAGAVVCVSQATRAEMLRFWRVDTERVVLAPHGPGQPLPRRPRASQPEHFLYVGDDEPRKGVGLLLQAHARYRETWPGPGAPLGLVLAGRAGRAAAGVRVEGRVSAERLAELHAGAAALVHPARHEGFGLTLIEAMALGTPVLAVANAAVREVCGDAVLHPHGDGATALAAELARLHREPELRARLSSAGPARAAGFSWRASARAHIEAYTLAGR